MGRLKSPLWHKTKRMAKILVIDDDRDITTLLQRFLTKNGYEVEIANTGKSGLAALEENAPDLLMCDYRLNDLNGSEILIKAKEIAPELPVIIITGYSDLRTAVNVIRLGAFDYVTKPLLPEEILHTVKKALAVKSEQKTEEENITASSNGVHGVHRVKSGADEYLFNESPESEHLFRQIELVAPTNYNVIIYGESGSGKEGVARAIHKMSKRSNKPFVAMDCGALSKELAASELFGHEKGSFTGAIGQKKGQFEHANGGTLLLDEVANLPYDVQVMLLRTIQEKKMRRVGGNKEIDIDVRIVVASNERLSEAARSGKFREDLYHRFNEFSIDVPSLRNRKGDIMFFADKFLAHTARELNKTITGFSDEVKHIFVNYPWYGNLRELKNIIKRAALLADKGKIEVTGLPFELVNYAKLTFDESESAEAAKVEHPAIIDEQRPVVTPVDTDTHITETVHHNEEHRTLNLKKAAQEAEYEAILDALKKAGFNKSKAAEILGIDRKTLYNKMKRINIER